jgi:hypothetical protein
MKDKIDPTAIDQELAERREHTAGRGPEPDLRIGGMSDADALCRAPHSVELNALLLPIQCWPCNPSSRANRVDARDRFLAERVLRNWTFPSFGCRHQFDLFGLGD